MDLAPATSGQTTTDPALLVHAVSRCYGAHKVLDGIELEVPKGQFVAVIGRSGCGKSTLLRLIAGLDTPSAGHIEFKRPTPPETQGLCVLFQDARLLPWRRVLANVGLGALPARRDAALAALRQVGLDAYADEWPAILSGGQKQRVALARALLRLPQLLLLDEPLGALDALTRIEMQRLIEALWQEHGFTALLVTHDVAEAITLADRIVMLRDGRIARDRVIQLPRPRRRDDPAFAEVEGEVLGWLLPAAPG